MPRDFVLVTQTVGAVLEVGIEVATDQGEHRAKMINAL